MPGPARIRRDHGFSGVSFRRADRTRRASASAGARADVDRADVDRADRADHARVRAHRARVHVRAEV
jgi:hypothetical protein